MSDYAEIGSRSSMVSAELFFPFIKIKSFSGNGYFLTGHRGNGHILRRTRCKGGLIQNADHTVYGMLKILCSRMTRIGTPLTRERPSRGGLL